MIFYCIRPIDGFYLVSSGMADRIISVTDDAYGRLLKHSTRCCSFERLLNRRIDHNVDMFPFPADFFLAPFEQAVDAGEVIGSYYLDTDIYDHFFDRSDKILGNDLDLVQFLRNKFATKKAIAKLGIPVPGVRPIPTATEQESDLVILRPSTSDGGTGIRLSRYALAEERENFAYAEEYIDGPSFNVHFTIGPDHIRVYEPSVQIIGVDILAPEPFAYCGGDFLAARNYYDGLVSEHLMTSTAQITEWLASLGYRGAGGVDFVVCDGVIYFLEVNPRMQCSSFALSIALAEDGRPTIDQLHCTAFLDKKVSYSSTVEFVSTSRTPPGHLVLVHDGEDGIFNAVPQDAEYDADLSFVRPFDMATPRRLLKNESAVWFCGAPLPGTLVQRGAQLGRIVSGRAILDSNTMKINEKYKKIIHHLRKRIIITTETK